MTTMWHTNDIVIRWSHFSVNELELMRIALEESLPPTGPIMQVGEEIQRRLIKELDAVLVLRGLQQEAKDAD